MIRLKLWLHCKLNAWPFAFAYIILLMWFYYLYMNCRYYCRKGSTSQESKCIQICYMIYFYELNLLALLFFFYNDVKSDLIYVVVI
jgi:hypothetical protein